MRPVALGFDVSVPGLIDFERSFRYSPDVPRPSIEDAHDRLLAAGLHLFARRGTERVNSNAIAKRARLAVGTFYNHFPNKHGISKCFSPRQILSQEPLDCELHCKCHLGQCVHTHKDGAAQR